MHIPDGFLNTITWVSTSIGGAAALGSALKYTQRTMTPKQMPQIALVGSFIFAAQMLNFPIAGATSGHFLGGALASILFGPMIASVVLSAVLIIQALVFQDGGITALGANLLMTAFVGSFAGYAVYSSMIRLLRGRGLFMVAFLAGWVSIVVASAGVGVLLAASGTFPIAVALKSMIGWHSVIGIGEGLITAMVAVYLFERRAFPQRGVPA